MVIDNKLLVLVSADYSGNNDYSNLCDEYNDIFEKFKGIPQRCDVKHHIDLLDPYKSSPKP